MDKKNQNKNEKGGRGAGRGRGRGIYRKNNQNIKLKAIPSMYTSRRNKIFII